jgi:chemotaxis protein CheZ
MAQGHYSHEEVSKAITSLMEKADCSQLEPLNHIKDELASLSKIIDDMHAEIRATRSHDVSGKFIPTATDELDAVIGATEEASATIMDSCEAIQAVAEDIDEVKAAEINAETIKIFEACSFQDITGQRISKVVKTLKDIEVTVDRLLQLFGTDKSVDLPEPEDERSEDEKLKNGPQLNGQGVSQDDIDKLLADFD